MTEQDILRHLMDDGTNRTTPGERVNAAPPPQQAGKWAQAPQAQAVPPTKMRQYGNQPGVAPGSTPTPPTPGPEMRSYGNQPGVAQPSGQTMRQSWDPATTSHQVQTGMPAPPRDAPGPASAPAERTGWGGYSPEGYDRGKIDSGHDSPKYQIGRVLSHFDPTQGLTPEVMAALNALGIGNIERISGDKLRVTGDYDPRFLDHTEFDVARNFTNDGSGSTAWQFQTMKDDPKGAGAGGPQGAPGMAGGPAGGGIAQLFPSDMSTYQTLEQQLQQILGGPRALDREALLSQMQR